VLPGRVETAWWGTRAGRSLLARIASNAVERAVSGQPSKGLRRERFVDLRRDLTNVRLYDADTSLVASLRAWI